MIPSMTLDESELTKLEGASFYEERLLFLLVRLRNPRAHMVYVTSQPVHPVILEYYFQLLAGNPGEPRALAADFALRPRRLAAVALTEKDPGAPAADPADPVRHPRPVARVHDGLQLDARSSGGCRCSSTYR